VPGLDVHQRRQLVPGELQLLPLEGDQRQRIEQRPLIGKRLRRRQDAARFGLARLFEGAFDALGQSLDLHQQTLRAERSPVSVAHVLDDVLAHLAAPLLGDVVFVTRLFGAVIAQSRNREYSSSARHCADCGAAPAKLMG
jgi:hypothetical protein